MATHKSAAVAARQRVHDHLQDQIEQLTVAVESGIKAAEQIAKIEQERIEFLETIEQRNAAAKDDLDAAVEGLRDLGQSKSEIARLLDVDPKLLISRRRRGATTQPDQADSMPTITASR